MSDRIHSVQVVLNVNHNEAGVINIETRPPWTKKKQAELGKMVNDMLVDQLEKIEKYYADIDAKCDCFAKERPNNHPMKQYHGSECAINVFDDNEEEAASE